MADAWIVMPVVNNFELTKAAIADCLAQEGVGTTRILVVQNSQRKALRQGLEELQETHPGRVLVVHHSQALGGPPFGCLNATWNRALGAVWAAGGAHALVVNNDVRLHPQTYACLVAAQVASSALFVSAVGVMEADWVRLDPREKCFDPAWWLEEWDREHKGGPDFSCYLMTRDCHKRYRLDPQYTFFGDNSYHRRLVLAGHGEKIFGVNVPYLHYGSQTLKKDPEFAKAYQVVVDEHRQRYVEMWGGMPGEETFLTPYDAATDGTLTEVMAKEMRLAAARKLQCERPPLR